MTIRTAGEPMALCYGAESSYGVSPTSALVWGADTIKLKPSTDVKKTFHILPKSRSFGQTTKAMLEAGFNIKAFSRLTSGGYDWRKLWAVYAMGATTGLTDHLGSFTAQLGTTVGASNFYDFYNGCKINKLTIGADGPSQPILFDADVISQYPTSKTTKVLTGLQALTIGADPSDITTALLTWASLMQINLAGGGLANFHPESWKLTIDNHLERKPGFVTGADSNKYAVAVGLDEGQRDIIFECVLPYEAETYNAAKMADSVITALTIPLDTFTLTLTTGSFEANDYPELQQALMKDGFKARFKTLSIA